MAIRGQPALSAVLLTVLKAGGRSVAGSNFEFLAADSRKQILISTILLSESYISRTMKYRLRIKSAAIWIITIPWMFAACSTYFEDHVDRLPAGTARGYIEFYFTEGSCRLLARCPRVAAIETFSTGYEAVAISASNKTRVAAIPGQHTYSMEIGTSKQSITINVQENMLTRVRMTYKSLGFDVEYYIRQQHWTTYFEITYAVEPPVPIPIAGRPL